MIFIAELLDVISVVRTAELSYYFFGDVPANVFAIIGLIFFLFFFDFAEKFKTSNVESGGGFSTRSRDIDDQSALSLSLYILAEHSADHGLVGFGSAYI